MRLSAVSRYREPPAKAFENGSDGIVHARRFSVGTISAPGSSVALAKAVRRTLAVARSGVNQIHDGPEDRIEHGVERTPRHEHADRAEHRVRPQNLLVAESRRLAHEQDHRRAAVER